MKKNRKELLRENAELKQRLKTQKDMKDLKNVFNETCELIAKLRKRKRKSESYFINYPEWSYKEFKKQALDFMNKPEEIAEYDLNYIGGKAELKNLLKDKLEELDKKLPTLQEINLNQTSSRFTSGFNVSSKIHARKVEIYICLQNIAEYLNEGKKGEICLVYCAGGLTYSPIQNGEGAVRFKDKETTIKARDILINAGLKEELINYLRS